MQQALDALRTGRVVVVALDDGGVALDTVTGAYYRLNAVGGMVLRVLSEEQGTLDDATDMLVARFGIDRAVAERDVVAMLAGIGLEGGPSVRRRDPGYVFAQEGETLWLAEHGRRMLGVSVDGRRVRAAAEASEEDLARCLMWAVASILALRGVLVLHASCVELGGKALAFSGESGAGKTTTARAFVRAGARPISEDTLVITHDANVVVAGEAAMMSWVREIVPSLVRGRVTTDELQRRMDGPRMVVAAVLLIDVARRAGGAITTADLAPAEALMRMIDSVFWGPKGVDSWGAAFCQCATLSAATAIREARTPLGVSQLQDAARDYIATYTS